MNIAQAKKQIKNAMQAYFTKDEFGVYKIPLEKQRPVLLIGPPGVGKTAIMEQIASELGVGLVSYSMTHHTRQSALGLPYIVEKEYGGKKAQVSEYTMSEIIASVYDLMQGTGIKEGILFLDEINCVSETLAPCMLQFLQYKIFGQHRVPDGWIVVTAGNPPEYNKSVRDFDLVTWDRLKRIDVEPDYEVWKTYALEKGVHPAVTTYLEARKKDFYKVESIVDGKNFVTARGWDDLSEMIRLYEENGIAVDELLVGQYLQDPRIAKDFAIYYDLFNKYRSDYQVEKILEGTAGEEVLVRAQNARLDERLSLLGLLYDAVTAELRNTCVEEDVLNQLLPVMKNLKAQLMEAGAGECAAASGEEKDSVSPETKRNPEPVEILGTAAGKLREKLENGKRASSLTKLEQHVLRICIGRLEELRAEILKEGITDGGEAFEKIRKTFGTYVEDLKTKAAAAGQKLTNTFSFCEEAFKDGDEMLIFVTELTAGYYSARFIGHYGCDKYYLHNKELQFKERQQEISQEIDKLNFDL